jgi:hypothetical protein
VLGRDTPIWKLERRCNAGYARREIRAAPSATRAGAVSLISAFGLRFWSRDHAMLLSDCRWRRCWSLWPLRSSSGRASTAGPSANA